MTMEKTINATIGSTVSREVKNAMFMNTMNSLTDAKKAARSAGYKSQSPIDTNGTYNGHLVEIAVCHLLGVVQRYIGYQLQINISSALDMNGVDIEIVPENDGIARKVQLKHTYRAENRDKEIGAYMLPLHNSRGFEVIEDMFRYYNIPLLLKSYKTYSNLRIELDYIWLMYTESLNNYYSSRY